MFPGNTAMKNAAMIRPIFHPIVGEDRQARTEHDLHPAGGHHDGVRIQGYRSGHLRLEVLAGPEEVAQSGKDEHA